VSQEVHSKGINPTKDLLEDDDCSEDIVAMPPRFKPRHERIEGERL